MGPFACNLLIADTEGTLAMGVIHAELPNELHIGQF